MKSRTLYLILIIIIIISFLAGFFIWRKNNLELYPKFDNEFFSKPLSSMFIPHNADIVFHWKINPNDFPTLLERYDKQSRQNNTYKKVESIINTSFNLIGVDFQDEVSKFAGQYGSFALLNNKDEKNRDWIMALKTKQNIDDGVMKNILNIQEDNNKIEYNPGESESYSDINIYRKSNLIKPIYFCNRGQYLLISSDLNIIELSIESSQENGQDSFIDSDYDKLKININDGFSSLEISEKIILELLNLKNGSKKNNQSPKLISSIDLQPNKIIFNSIIKYNEIIGYPKDDNKEELLFTNNDRFLSDNLILINSAKEIFNQKEIAPYISLIRPLLENSIDQDSLPLLKLISQNSEGPLIWLKNMNNWAIISRKDMTNKINIEKIILEEKFTKSTLDFENIDLEVWSKLATNTLEKEPYIERETRALVQENKETYLWSKSLSSISDNNQKEYFINNLPSEDNNKDYIDIIRIHLGEEKTKDFLKEFYPFILFKATVGNMIALPKEMDVSITRPNIEDPEFLKSEISFKVG